MEKHSSDNYTKLKLDEKWIQSQDEGFHQKEELQRSKRTGNEQMRDIASPSFIVTTNRILYLVFLIYIHEMPRNISSIYISLNHFKYIYLLHGFLISNK